MSDEIVTFYHTGRNSCKGPAILHFGAGLHYDNLMYFDGSAVYDTVYCETCGQIIRPSDIDYYQNMVGMGPVKYSDPYAQYYEMYEGIKKYTYFEVTKNMLKNEPIVKGDVIPTPKVKVETDGIGHDGRYLTRKQLLDAKYTYDDIKLLQQIFNIADPKLKDALFKKIVQQVVSRVT